MDDTTTGGRTITKKCKTTNKESFVRDHERDSEAVQYEHRIFTQTRFLGNKKYYKSVSNKQVSPIPIIGMIQFQVELSPKYM